MSIGVSSINVPLLKLSTMSSSGILISPENQTAKTSVMFEIDT